MADGNAALQLAWLQFAWLQACDVATALLLCCDGGSSRRAALASRVDGYAALQRWHFRAEIFVFVFFFFLLGNFNGLFYAREEENDKLLYAQVRAREQEKNRARKRKKEKERESFETCLV
jgi:hypothetical protein